MYEISVKAFILLLAAPFFVLAYLMVTKVCLELFKLDVESDAAAASILFRVSGVFFSLLFLTWCLSVGFF